MSAPKKKVIKWTEEELLNMSHEEAVEGLDEQKQRFCEYYVSSHNAISAAIKAGFNVDIGSKATLVAKNNIKCQRYIAWMKLRIFNNCMIRGEEIIDAWVRIAFADLTDFVDILPYGIRLKPSNQVDGQLVKSIKSGRDGVSIELYDKMKALDALSKYVDFMPSDWKQRVEERKVSILEQELEIKKQMLGKTNEDDDDDGFLEALAKSSKNINWE